MAARGAKGRWRRAWASYRGVGPLALLLLALVLGYVGYRSYFDAAGEHRPWYDLLYFDLQLLTFNFRSAADPSVTLPWALQVARMMAPLVAGYGALVAMMRLFRDRVDQSRTRFRRRHTIVVGAGATGLAFVRSLGADGRKVVVVDKDAGNPSLDACRELGALVLKADARQPESMIQAGVGEADHLVAVCGDDGTNVEVLMCAQRVRRNAARPLRCLAHVVDPELWQLLRANDLASTDDAAVHLDCFNLYEHGARAMVGEHPPGGEASSVLVVGAGPLAARVVVQLARRVDGVSLTVLAPGAGALREQVVAEAPQIEDHAQLRTVDAPLGPAGIHGAAIPEDVDIAYVCVDTDTAAIVAAQALRSKLPLARIVVSLRRSEGIVELLEHRYAAGLVGVRRIAPFPLLDRTCHPEALLAGAHEAVAEEIHARYRQDQLAAGVHESDPRVALWADLDPERQSSNRSQAAAIGPKLRAIGCALVPQRGWETPPFAFTASEIDRLARREHDRWRAGREANGWRLGAVRDEAARRTPLLVN